ncbi:hypothetical protein F4778DRAFT_764488 [Xylariomycetidae sp. FL2044]|nr:hypothetical protein F4778DRAFT_764488 [Xylariomycetidae sp. FL2044]
MFFTGSVQDGVRKALEQKKLVVCFVTDGGEESQIWENEFLADEAVKPVLESQAVVLRFEPGSDGLAFLEDLFPIPKKPTLVVIRDTQLREYLAAGTAKDDFIKRMATAVGTETQTQPAARSDPPVTGYPPRSSAVPLPSLNGGIYHDAPPAPDASSNHEAASSPTPTPRPVVRLPPAGQADADKTLDKEKGKATSEDTVTSSEDAAEPNKANAEKSYAQEVRQRKQQAKDEKKRILKRIEDDKRARKERDAEERKARYFQRLIDGPEADEGSKSNPAESSIPLMSRAVSGKKGKEDQCSLQVRLFDGSTIRSKFPSDKTLHQDVRAWVDAERTDSDAPYMFRVMFPGKMIEPTQEIKSLFSLGLAPSATLILVPVKYTSAYGRMGMGVGGDGFSAGMSVIWRVLGPLVALFARAYSAILAALIILFGRGRRNGRDTEQDGIPLENLTSRGRRNTRVRGFQNPDDHRRDAQLYNGNSLNFEPRRDEDEE